MPERLAQAPTTERTPFQKMLYKGGFFLSFVTLPLAVVTAGKSLVAGKLLETGLASGWAFLDYTQIKEHSRKPEEQSWYNPEKIWDRIFGTNRGSNRFKALPTSSMVHATSTI